MRSYVMIALALLAGASFLYGQPNQETVTGRVARLIRQLGHEQFARREAASEELNALGEPALPALRKAAASADVEIRWRAEQAVRSINGKKELANWEGTWMTEDRAYLKLSEARFSSGTPTFGPGSGTITIVEVGTKVIFGDFVNDDGPLKGKTALAIFRRDGETLDACWTYTTTRPTDFKNEGNNYCFNFKRVKK